MVRTVFFIETPFFRQVFDPFRISAGACPCQGLRGKALPRSFLLDFMGKYWLN
jgi:hypothetical protein